MSVVASQFSENRNRMLDQPMTPILPPTQSMAAGVTSVDLRGSFGTSVGNDESAELRNQHLAASAMTVGANLTDNTAVTKLPEMKPNQKGADLSGDTIIALGSLLGSPKPEEQQAPEAPVRNFQPAPAMQMGMPSPTGG